MKSRNAANRATAPFSRRRLELDAVGVVEVTLDDSRSLGREGLERLIVATARIALKQLQRLLVGGLLLLHVELVEVGPPRCRLQLVEHSLLFRVELRIDADVGGPGRALELGGRFLVVR